VYWKIGQALLPEHFLAQEESLRDEFRTVVRLTSGPCWGVGALRWDPLELAKGKIKLEELTLLLPSGLLIDVPVNTEPAALDVTSAGSTASVYLHLQTGFKPVRTAGQGERGEEGIERMVQQIALSTEPSSATSLHAFKLAELRCELDGAWALSAGYVPPLLTVGGNPFFEPARRRVDALVRRLRELLVAEVQQNFLAAEGNAASRIALRGLFGVDALLADLDAGLPLHPYALFSALRALYIDFCVAHDSVPADLNKPYLHDDLAGVFGGLLDRLEAQVSGENRSVPYAEFARRDGLIVGELKREVRRARDVFLLVQKPYASTKLDMTRVKLASELRIRQVYERSLKGIPFEHVSNPPFSHGLASTIEFFTVTPGPEWDFAVREGKVVLLDDPDLKGLRFYLYWRDE
jgi:type VI secretion system protein ImpJ